VQAGTPLYGPNLFPEVPAGMRATVLQYMAALTELGQRLMAGVALGLGLPESYFAEQPLGSVERPHLSGDVRRLFAWQGRQSVSGIKSESAVTVVNAAK